MALMPIVFLSQASTCYFHLSFQPVTLTSSLKVMFVVTSSILTAYPVEVTGNAFLARIRVENITDLS